MRSRSWSLPLVAEIRKTLARATAGAPRSRTSWSACGSTSRGRSRAPARNGPRLGPLRRGLRLRPRRRGVLPAARGVARGSPCTSSSLWIQAVLVPWLGRPGRLPGRLPRLVLPEPAGDQRPAGGDRRPARHPERGWLLRAHGHAGLGGGLLGPLVARPAGRRGVPGAALRRRTASTRTRAGVPALGRPGPRRPGAAAAADALQDLRALGRRLRLPLPPLRRSRCSWPAACATCLGARRASATATRPWPCSRTWTAGSPSACCRGSLGLGRGARLALARLAACGAQAPARPAA